MLGVVLSLISMMLVVAITIFVVVRSQKLEDSMTGKLQGVVDQVNDANRKQFQLDSSQADQLTDIDAKFKEASASMVAKTDLEKATLMAKPFAFWRAVDLQADQLTANGAKFASGIKITGNNPGSMLEKNYGTTAPSKDNRYGIAQDDRGTMRMYAAGNFAPATLNLSFAQADGTYSDAVTIVPNKDATMNGDLFLKRNLTTEANAIIYSKGRMHVNGEETLYLLNKNGTVVSKAWGGNGNLNVEGDLTVGANQRLCLGTTCLNAAQIQKLAAM